MRQQTSHNKTIKLMHEMTELPYSECRRKLKECHWDLYTAVGFDQICTFIDNFSEIVRPCIEALVDSAKRIAEGLVEALSRIDFEKIMEAINEYNRQNSNESISLAISSETTGTEEGDQGI